MLAPKKFPPKEVNEQLILRGLGGNCNWDDKSLGDISELCDSNNK